MHIDKKLNLVLPFERADKSKIFLHSTPISAEVFDHYWEVISMAMTSVYAKGLSLMGTRIAYKALRDVSIRERKWEGPEGVDYGLMSEIRRLTNVLSINGAKGWEMLQFDDACKKGVLDEDERAEAESSIVFFMLLSVTTPKSRLMEILPGAMMPASGQITSSGCTEYLNSLRTSIETESSGEKAA